MSKSALIVGAGLGGLLCGRILSREGWQLTLLEADSRPGGVLHSFDWDGIPCDVGFHSVGGLGPGEALERIFRPLGLMDLPWYRADADEGMPFMRLNAASDFEMAHVLEPYRKGVWRLHGGGDTLVSALSEGQDIRCRHTVQSIQNKVVTCQDGSVFSADIIISDLSPDQTVLLLKDHLRLSYIHRLAKLTSGPDILQVYCLLEQDCVPWQSGAVFLSEPPLMLHFDEPGTSVLELMCYGQRKPEDMVAQAARRLPGLKVRRYLARSVQGFGIRKYEASDCIAPLTPLPWLYLTGQNLGLHGVLGTAVSALVTCKSIQS